MGKKQVVPDAWDDDWEEAADKAEVEADSKEEEVVKITKAERLAKHAEENKKIWENAEEPETPFFLAARSEPPLQSTFKPALKVLSRKPIPKTIQKIDPVTGLVRMTLEDEDDEEEVKKDQLSPEELRAKAQKEREEKQRKYDEARARILGTGSSGSGTTTPPGEEGRGSRGKRGGRGGRSQQFENTRERENSRPSSQSGSKELYDPNYTPKPGVMIQKRGGEPQRSSPKLEDQILRSPRGPEANSKGFGSSPSRRGKTS